MANESEKKALKKYQHLQKLYLNIIIALTVLYVLLRIIYCYDSFLVRHWIGFAFLCAVNYFGYRFLMHYLSLGYLRTTYGFYEEVLWINWFVMATSIISDYFWIFYLSIPGYGLYKFGPMVFNFFFPSRPVQPELSAVEQLKADKKAEKKANKVRYVR